MLMERMNPHNKASAVDSPAVGLVYDPIIRKTKLKTDEKPYTFSTTGDLAHILGASPGVASKKFLFVADITLTLHKSCRAPAVWGLCASFIALCSDRR